jgi:stage III sporulation protein AF
MREYVMTVIVSGMVGAVVMQLAPSGEMKKYVRIAVSLVLVIVCISPLLSLAEEVQGLDLSFLSEEDGEKNAEYREVFEAGYGAAEEENLRAGIKAFLYDRFGVEESEVTVSLRISEENGERRLERIFLTLCGSAIWKDTGEIERELGALLGCEVITAVD